MLRNRNFYQIDALFPDEPFLLVKIDNMVMITGLFLVPEGSNSFMSLSN